MCVLNIQSTSFKKGESRQIRDIVRMLGMNITGEGLEQDVAMENVDMKIGPVTGAAGMAGSAASPHLLYFVILSVFRAVCGSIFGRLQAVGRCVRRPQGRRADRPPVLLLPTLCLALAFVFFNAAGAMAQQECTGDPTQPGCGDNTDPVADAGDNATVNAGGTISLDGTGSSDGEGEVTYAWTRADGTTTGLTDANTSTPDFTAPDLVDGAPDVEHVITLTVTDEAGATATDTVTITVNAPPLAEAGDPATVNAGGMISLDGTGSSDTTGTLTYAWTRADGTTTGLTDADTSTPDFTAPDLVDGAPDVEHVITLTVTDAGATDNVRLTDTDTVTITVNAPPLAEAGDPATVNAGGTISLDGTGSSDTTGTLTYAWTRADGTTTGLTDADTSTPDFTASDLVDGAPDVEHVFTLTVTDAGATDNVRLTDTDTVTITVNAPPLAEAGDPATVNAGGTISLDGTGSSDTTGTLTYAWTRADGTTTGLTDADTSTPDFTAPDLVDGAPDVEHVFTLTVTDAGATDNVRLTDTDTVTITVNAPPLAEAGDPATVNAGGTISLDGTGSSDTTGTLTYAWTRADGTTTGLTDADTSTPDFTAPDLVDGAPDVEHVITLTVTDAGATDNVRLTDTDTVTITVNAPPLAEAGDPATVNAGGTISLDGTGSSDTTGTLTYAWTRADGTTTGLTDADTSTPDFTAPDLVDGAPDVEHVITLTVTDAGATDNVRLTDTDTVTVTVNAPPLAEAGDPATVNAGGTISLDGTGSSDTTGTLTYAWTRADGTTTGLTDADTSTPDFTAPDLVDGAPDVEHVFTLTVTDAGATDNVRLTDTDTVTITVNAPPLAEAGDPATVNAGGTISLDGTGSSDTTGTLTYAWTRADGTTTGLTDADTSTPDFTAPDLVDGAPDVEHVITLTVTDAGATDNVRLTDTDTVTITVTSDNALPVAVVTQSMVTVDPGDPVTLNGTGTDSGGTIASWTWTRTGGDGDENRPLTVTATGENTATLNLTLSFMADAADTLEPGGPDVTHEFTLIVTDDEGAASAPVITTVTVQAPPFAALVAQAGPAQPAVPSGMQGVQLDGTGSTVTGGRRNVTYAWTQTGGDAATVTLIGANTLQPTFTAQTLNPGDDDVTYEFTLTVTDDQSSAPATDTVTVTVTAATVDIVVSPPEVSVQEGGSGTYRVRLSKSPGREVTITADSGNKAVVRLKNTRLVFNANNWNDWQEVEIDAVADSVKKGDGIEVIIEHILDGVASKKLAVVTVSVRAQEDDPILDHVGQFIATRATTLLGQQPDLIHFLKQDGLTQDSGGSFTFQATDGRLSLDGGFIHDGTWGEVTGARTNSDSTDTKSVLGSFGIHRKYSETFLTGLMLQFDRADHELPQQTGTIDGTGWLVGPYFVARHGSQPLYFEGRLLYGYSDNDIRFMDRHLGARTGSFDSTRVLAQIRVEGEIAVPGWDHGDDGGAEVPQLIPYADLRWLEDRAAAFTTVSATTGFRVPVPGQTVNISQLELGSNMVVPVAVPTGSMILTGGLGLVFSNTEGNHIKSDAHGRGRGEIGFSYGLDENVQIDFESFYDGIGSSGYEGYGLSLNAEMRF